MKLALAFMMQDSLNWLGLHLPVYRASGVFDGVIALDGGSTDRGVQYVESLGGIVYHRTFNYHFGKQGNALVHACEYEGYDAIYRADPDELVSAEDLRLVRDTLEAHPDKLIGLSRLNFIGDRLHIQPDWRPDTQWRAWSLNRGIHYDDAAVVHELPTGAERLELPQATIFHYAWIASADERNYRTALYQAMKIGDPLPKRADYVGQTLNIPSVPYDGVQPLNPLEVGIYAPFTKEPA